MKRSFVAIAAVLAVLLLLSTDESSWAKAKVGLYKGPYPAPGAITAFDTVLWRAHDETKAGAPPFLIPHSTNQALHKVGTLDIPPQSDSVIILIYGDNRPGFRLMTTGWGVPAVMNLGSRDFSQFAYAIANIPVALIQFFVPKLDFFRDLAAWGLTSVYSGGREDPVLRALEREVARDPRVSFIVQTGDVVENGKRGALYETFVKKHTKLRTTAPYLTSPGNHEATYDPVARQNYAAVMGPPAEDQRFWFAVDFPESLARFVFLDTNVMTDAQHHYPDSLENQLAEEQIAWVDSALAVPARYRFVVMHHPLVTSGHYFNTWVDDDNREIEASRRRRLLQIFRKRKVTAVLAGHEHLYLRTYIRGLDGKGFWHISTGGAGAPLYRVSKRERSAALAASLPDSSRVTWNKAQSVYHYIRMTLLRRPKPGEERIVLDVFRVRSNGQVYPIDHVDLTQLPPPEKPAGS